VRTYEEWRVTGDPGEGFPPYTFTFSPIRGDDDPEAAARKFVKLVFSHGRWPDGPHLHKRTVTVTDWTEVDA
jgi:hypothetical protein